MSLFDKLFKRNKNVIELDKEDFTEPLPETDPDTDDFAVTLPIFRLDGTVFFSAANIDEAYMNTRFALRNAVRGFSENENEFDIFFGEHINATGRVNESNVSEMAGYRLFEAETRALADYGYALKLDFSGNDENKLRTEANRIITHINDDLDGLAILDGQCTGNAAGSENAEVGTTTEQPDFHDLPEGSRGKTIMSLRAHGIIEPVNVREGLLGENNYPRNDTDVIKRISGLLYTAMTALSAPVPGQTLPAGRYSQQLSKLSDRYAAKDSLSAKESEYVKQPNVSVKAAMSLKTEAAALLLWYLGLWELPWADTTSDIAELTGTLSPSGMEETLSRVRTRSRNEIEDMYDLTVCQHWLTVRLNLNELSGASLDPDIIYARHYALNWLMRVGGKKKWDSVVPTT